MASQAKWGGVMTLNDAGTISALAVSIFGVIGGLFITVKTYTGLVVRFVRLENRVEGNTRDVQTLWNFLFRRAQSEAVKDGYADPTLSTRPLAIKPEATHIMAPIADDLRKFYAKQPKPISDFRLAILIEDTFGDFILHEVCYPNGLHMGACLTVAVAVCKGEDMVCLT